MTTNRPTRDNDAILELLISKIHIPDVTSDKPDASFMPALAYNLLIANFPITSDTDFREPVIGLFDRTAYFEPLPMSETRAQEIVYHLQKFAVADSHTNYLAEMICGYNEQFDRFVMDIRTGILER